jgi:hypothetical protein
LARIPSGLTRIEENANGSHEACKNPHQAYQHPRTQEVVQDMVYGMKRDNLCAPQGKRKQDSRNREQSAGPGAKDAQGRDYANQEQHRQDHDGD